MSQLFEPKAKRMTQRDRVDEAAWEGRFAAIEKEADAILKAEGAHFVRGIHFVQAGDAYMARMIAAEQVVAKRDASMDRYVATGRAAKRTMKQQGPSAYTVYATNGRDVDGSYLPDLYCGSYETLPEARGCVGFDGLTSWEIWLGDRIVDESAKAPCPEMSVTEGLSDADLAARMLQHTAMVCRLVTDAMGVKS